MIKSIFSPLPPPFHYADSVIKRSRFAQCVIAWKARVSGFYTRSVMLYDVASQVDGSRSGNLGCSTNNLSRHVYFILLEEHVSITSVDLI